MRAKTTKKLRYYIMHDLLLNDKNVTFEIDTGATMSVISDRMHAQHFGEVPLQKTNIVLKAYDGACIKPLGAMSATIQHNDMKVPCVFLVIRNGGQPLIGRDILDKIKFEFVCNSLSDVNVNNLIDEFSVLFNDELGSYKYENVNFKVKTNTVPIFCKARKMLLAFVDAVDKEIDRLVKEGVLELTTEAQWGTPIVPILKKGTKDVRVCVDYRITINPHLIDVNGYIPTIEEIFASLYGGVVFEIRFQKRI